MLQLFMQNKQDGRCIMTQVLTTAITVSLISIILPMILKAEEKNNDSDNDKIVFEFGKKIKICMLVITILFIIILLACTLAVVLNDDKEAIVAIVIFSVFTLLSSFLYVLTRNKKIIYVNNKFYYYNIIGKKSLFNVLDIKEAIENPSDGMKLVFNDGRKLKVDTQMINYVKIKEILDKNNIKYTDRHGNNAPKGW